MAFAKQDWGVLPPGAQESMALGRFTAVVKYIGPWEDRISFANSMIGATYWPFVVRLGQRNTPNPPRGVSATMAAFKGDQQAIGPRTDALAGISWVEEYEKAVVTVTYELPGVGDPVETQSLNGRTGGLISEDFRPNAEFTTLDNDDFEWKGRTGVTLTDKHKIVSDKEAPGKLFVGMDYIFTRHGVTNVSPEVFTLVNHVNDSPLTLLTPLLRNTTFAPETVLYRGASLDRNVNLRGESNMDLVMTFALRQVPDPGNLDSSGNPIAADQQIFYGWNHFFHGGVGKWLQLKRKDVDGVIGGIHRNFPSADLKKI